MTGDHHLLLTHASRWAEKKKRPFDPELAEVVLDLRGHDDEREPGWWPAGSAEHLVLVRWPAHGPAELPETAALAETLETLWRFLRGTGRMAAASAEPVALVKELRRALPRMAEACADRSTWSQGRVFADFGASMGIDLSMSESIEEAQEKMGAIMQAWNDLPMEERVALMPDPTPTSAAGLRMTDLINAGEWGDVDDEEVYFRRGDRGVAAEQARTSEFTRACLRLADWVGERREVTSAGVLRPAVAREAFDELDLFEWERAHSKLFNGPRALSPSSEEEWDSQRYASKHSWKSALDYEPLHRLWRACWMGGLIDIHRTVARRSDVLPRTDGEWLELAVRLVVGLVGGDGGPRVNRNLLMGPLLMPLTTEDGTIQIEALTEWWLDRREYGLDVAHHGEDGARVFKEIYTAEVQDMLRMYDDTAMWTRSNDRLTLTEFGREAGVVLANLVDSGWFDHT